MTHCFRRLLRTTAGVSVLVAIMASAPRARAQELMHGFVDPCTVENHQEMTTVCELCPVPSSDPEACTKRLGKLGYQKKCSTVGHHDGKSEVWCIEQAKAPGAAPPPASAAPSAPSPSSRSQPLLLVGVPLLLAALVLIQRAWSRRALKK